MRRQRKLEEKLVFGAFGAFSLGLALMTEFGEVPFIIGLVISLVLCIAGGISGHKQDRLHRRNRYLP